MRVGKSYVGFININWPNKLVIGNYCNIEDFVTINIRHPFDNSSHVKIGDGVFIGNYCLINCSTKIEIGDNCLIASNTVIVDSGHTFVSGTIIREQPVTNSPIKLEDDVWIGAGCKILQGVTIGKGSIIAAGSVVNKSIPPSQVWGGIPAKFIKDRK